MADVVWQSKLDNRYDLRVERTGSHTGRLTVHDGDKLLGEKEVGLSYGAQFGPDVADVAEWQEWGLGVVDNESGDA